MRKIIYFVIAVIPAYLWADCNFIINNYSDTPLTTTIGFYTGDSKTVSVPGSGSREIQIKSDLQCNSASVAGLGQTYINLEGGKSKGNWVYSPESKMIRAVGMSFSDSRGVVGIAPDGTKLILFNKYNPSDDKFEVAIEKANRNISLQLSSMD
jgi:hypothetical protein